jgi:hypothetical protein
MCFLAVLAHGRWFGSVLVGLGFYEVGDASSEGELESLGHHREEVMLIKILYIITIH